MPIPDHVFSEPDLRNNLSANLKRLLDRRGITQNRLAKAVGVSASAIGMIFHKRNTPNVLLVAAIATVLGSTVDEMIGFPKPRKRS